MSGMAANRSHERLRSEKHQVRRADDLERGKRRLRRLQEASQPDACGNGPYQLPRCDSAGGEQTAASSADDRVADGEGSVRPGGTDHECAHPKKCQHFSHQRSTSHVSL